MVRCASGSSQERITVPTIDRPHIELEEVDGEEVLMRIEATPRADTDGPRLADEVLAAVAVERRTEDRRAA